MARKVTALVPWFGSNRTLAENVGSLLRGCRWVGVPFAGGMCELAHIDAPTLVVSDLHRWVINLARVVADPLMRPELIRQLDAKLYHPDELAASQERMRSFDRQADAGFFFDLPAAVDYFVCAWMGRSAKAGTGGEFDGSLPTRYTPTAATATPATARRSTPLRSGARCSSGATSTAGMP
jgi:DNA adenine methylase